MVKIFQNNGIGQFVIFAVAALLLWGRSFVAPPEVVCHEGFSPLYQWLYLLTVDHQRVATIAAFVLVVLEGLWLSTLLYNYKIVAQNSLLPALIYLTAMSFDAHSQTLTPTLFVNALLLFYLDRLMLLGVPNLHFGNIFDSSATIAVASMFYTPALLLLLPHFVVMFFYKQYRWRDWVVMLLGFLAPTILLLLVLFLGDDLSHALFLIDYDLTSPRLTIVHDSVLHYVANALFVVALLVSLMSFGSFSGDLAADSKKNAVILTLLLSYSLTQLFYTRLYPVDTQMMALPFAYLFNAFLLMGRRRNWIADVCLVSLFIIALI